MRIYKGVSLLMFNRMSYVYYDYLTNVLGIFRLKQTKFYYEKLLKFQKYWRMKYIKSE